MSVLHSWGIGVIECMQATGGPHLDGSFKGITFVENEEFYLLLNRSKDIVSSMAAFWGFALGHLFLSRFFSHSTSGATWKRLVRYPIGLIGMVAVYLGLKALFPEEGEGLYLMFRFVRYALLGLWVGLAAPLVFRLLHLNVDKSESTGKQALP